MGDSYVITQDLGLSILNVDLGSAHMIPADPGDTFCGSYFVKEAVPSTSAPPLDGYDFFYIRTAKGSQPYLGVIWPGGSSDPDATTMFSIAAVAAVADDALIFATGTATDTTPDVGQGISTVTLQVFLSSSDTTPKGICAPGSSAYRVYKAPVQCEGYAKACPLSWQACGPSNYCFDRSLLPKPKSQAVPAGPPTGDPVTGVWYPNCPSRKLVFLKAADGDKESACVTPPQINETKARIQALQTATKDKAYAYATWAVGGIVILLGLVLGVVAYVRTVKARASFESHLAELAKLRRLKQNST